MDMRVNHKIIMSGLKNPQQLGYFHFKLEWSPEIIGTYSRRFILGNKTKCINTVRTSCIENLQYLQYEKANRNVNN